MALKLALPPAMDETPFTTTGSLSLSHPFQVPSSALHACCERWCILFRGVSMRVMRKRLFLTSIFTLLPHQNFLSSIISIVAPLHFPSHRNRRRDNVDLRG
jgi:hypothetical protein